MMHKTWSSREKAPYCFFYILHQISRSRRLTNRRFESSLNKITRPVAAIKSLRFAPLTCISHLISRPCGWAMGYVLWLIEYFGETEHIMTRPECTEHTWIRIYYEAYFCIVLLPLFPYVITALSSLVQVCCSPNQQRDYGNYGNYIHVKHCDVITHPITNINSKLVKS